MNIRPKNKISAEASMSSMTDLVFLMLIFFVILSTLVSPGLKVDLPAAGQSETESGTSISITIDANQQHYVNDTPVSKEQIPEMVNSEIRNRGGSKVVKIRVDKSVPSGMMVHLLDIAKANQWVVSIAANQQ